MKLLCEKAVELLVEEANVQRVDAPVTICECGLPAVITGRGGPKCGSQVAGGGDECAAGCKYREGVWQCCWVCCWWRRLTCAARGLARHHLCAWQY